MRKTATQMANERFDLGAKLASTTTIAEVTVPASKRSNREPYFVARDVISGDITTAVRDALKSAPDGDVTFILSTK